jgi:hypothetical protein
MMMMMMMFDGGQTFAQQFSKHQTKGGFWSVYSFTQVVRIV